MRSVSEQEITDAIITGIIGLAFLFLAFRGIIPSVLSEPNVNLLIILMFLFLIVGMLRIYGTILKSSFLRRLSIHFFKIVAFPYTLWIFPSIILTELRIILPPIIINGVFLFFFEFTIYFAFRYLIDGIKEEIKRLGLKKEFDIEITLFGKTFTLGKKKKSTKPKPSRQHSSKS